jgi:fumarylacetoacetate (FAA) hydrolase family protein
MRSVQVHGLCSQDLEAGIGPHAEIFGNAPVLSSVGTGADIGIRSNSYGENELVRWQLGNT